MTDLKHSQVTSVKILLILPMSMTYNKPLTERLLSLYYKG